MLVHRVTDTEIAIRICPKRLRWPERDSSVAWAKAHDCASAFDNLIRSLDIACFQAEQNREISASGLARRRAELCDRALRKLVNFRPFESAEKGLSENIIALERLSYPDAEQSHMHQTMTKALADLREGIEATRRMVLARGNGRVSGLG